jgi:hypothetical protein
MAMYVTPKTTEPNPQGLEREVGLEKPTPVMLLERPARPDLGASPDLARVAGRGRVCPEDRRTAMGNTRMVRAGDLEELGPAR